MENVLYESAGYDTVVYCEPYKHGRFQTAKQESQKVTENPLYVSASPYVNSEIKPFAIYMEPRSTAFTKPRNVVVV